MPDKTEITQNQIDALARVEIEEKADELNRKYGPTLRPCGYDWPDSD